MALNARTSSTNTPSSHDLTLSQTGCLGTLHGITVGLVGIADVGETKGPSTILVASEFGYTMLAGSRFEAYNPTY